MVSAREIAASHELPHPLVMKILKALHHAEIVESARGPKGGYQLAIDLRDVSLFDLVDIVSRMDDGNGEIDFDTKRLPTEPPLLAVHHKMMRFLKDVTLADLVMPGRRIDVPVELLKLRKRRIEQLEPATSLAG